MAFLRDFEFYIRQIKGKENNIAYTLSIDHYNLIKVSVRNFNIHLIEKTRNSITSDPKYLEIQQKL